MIYIATNTFAVHSPIFPSRRIRAYLNLFTTRNSMMAAYSVADKTGFGERHSSKGTVYSNSAKTSRLASNTNAIIVSDFLNSIPTPRVGLSLHKMRCL